MAKTDQELKALLEEIRDLLIPVAKLSQYQVRNIERDRQVSSIKDQLFSQYLQEQAKKQDEEKKDDTDK